jgi:hypothetical protein
VAGLEEPLAAVDGGDIASGDIGDVADEDITGGDNAGGDIADGDIAAGDIPGGDIPGGDSVGWDSVANRLPISVGPLLAADAAPLAVVAGGDNCAKRLPKPVDPVLAGDVGVEVLGDAASIMAVMPEMKSSSETRPVPLGSSCANAASAPSELTLNGKDSQSKACSNSVCVIVPVPFESMSSNADAICCSTLGCPPLAVMRSASDVLFWAPTTAVTLKFASKNCPRWGHSASNYPDAAQNANAKATVGIKIPHNWCRQPLPSCSWPIRPGARECNPTESADSHSPGGTHAPGRQLFDLCIR